MKNTINLFLVASVLCSCNAKNDRIDLYAIREDSLIYQLVDSLILPDSSWRKHLFPQPVFPENYSKMELKRLEDSLLQRWDTAKLYVAFHNTFIDFPKSYLSPFENPINNANELKLDSAYFASLYKRISDTVLTERAMDISRIHSAYNYNIVPYDSVEKVREKGFQIVEIYEFSRIIFSPEFDKACFYMSSVCGRLCGGGYLVFLEKKNGIWTVIGRELIWVS